MVKLSGGCLCGNIRYKILKEPLLAYTCNCRFCQKDTGTAHRSALATLNEYLDLSGNELTGPIPPEIRNLVGLESLSIYSNQLKG